MTITALAITNPGAEAGTTTGWTQSAGVSFAARTVAMGGGGLPYAGTYMFYMGGGDNAAFYQQIDISAYAVAIDADLAAINLQAWHRTMASNVVWQDDAALRIQFYNNALALISTTLNPYTSPTAWTRDQILVDVPVNTRYIRIGALCNGSDSGSEQDVYWDDFTADISDSRFVDYPGVFEPQVSQYGTYALTASDLAEGGFDLRTQMLGAYSLGTAPAEEAYGNQMAAQILGQAEEASGFHDVTAYQFGAYALVASFPDRRDLRAWTFTQDDHDFYVLHVGPDGTIIYDKLTEQWCTWWSPGYRYWRGADGCEWAGMNLACDQRSGRIWEVDPTGRADYGDTPIESKVTGMVPARLRQAIPVYAGELIVSQGQPSESLEGVEVGINLRFSDDGMVSWVDMGTVVGEPYGQFTMFRWYGLGQFSAPGRIFEIVDTGYARRIDSFDISVGGEGE
jgi:hypothetical protein